MTREHKLIVGLEEITSIILECSRNGCGSRVVFSPDKTESLPPNCPHGHHWEWGMPDRQPFAGPVVGTWLQLLRRMREGAASGTGFKVFLGFDEPSHGRDDRT